MDPLTALSTAGTLVQFVDFALKVLTTGHQLYKLSTGPVSANEELKCVARDVSALAKRLNHVQPASQNEPALEDLSRKCENIAQELMEHLGILRAQGKREALKNFRNQFKATWDQQRLDVLVQKLQFLSKSLETWFLVDIE